MTDQIDQQEPKFLCSVLGKFVGESKCKGCTPVPDCRRNACRLRLEAEFGDLPKAAALGGRAIERPEELPVYTASPAAGDVEVAINKPEEDEQQEPRRAVSPSQSISPAAGLNDSDVTALAGDPVPSATPAADPAVASADQPLADVQDHDTDSKDSIGPGPGDLAVAEKARPRRRQTEPSQPTVPPTPDALDAPATTGADTAPEAPLPDPQEAVEEAAERPNPVAVDTTGVDPEHPDRQDEGAPEALCDSEDPAVPPPPGETSPKRKKRQAKVPGNHAADNGKASAKTGRCSSSNAGPREVKDKARRGDPAAACGDTPAGAAPPRPEHRVSSEDAHGRKCLGQRTVPLVDIRVGEVVTRKVNAAYVTQLTQVLKADRDLSPLVVDQDMNLADGHQRLAALEKVGKTETQVTVFAYDDAAARVRHAVELNLGHGRRYSGKERTEIGVQLFLSGMPIDEIAELFAVTTKAVENWTWAVRLENREALTQKAVGLRAQGMTQVQIAAELGLTRDMVRTLLGERRTRSQIPQMGLDGVDGVPDTAPDTEPKATAPIDMAYEATRLAFVAGKCLKGASQHAQEELDRWRDAIEDLELGLDFLAEEVRQAGLRIQGTEPERS